MRALVAAADGPASSATAVAESGGVPDKATDAAQYTGAHKARFDTDGRGRGLAGRDPAPKGAGTGHRRTPSPGRVQEQQIRSQPTQLVFVSVQKP